MAIQYTPKYNAEIRRRVHNFNQTRKRAAEAGVPKNRLPRPVKVSELKANFKNKRDLERFLNHLDRFTRKSTNNRINITDDLKTTKWLYEFVKANRNLAKQYFEEEFKRVEKHTSRFPGERSYLNTLSAKIDLLSMNLNELTDPLFKSSLAAVNEYLESPSLRKTKYRSFLSEVELVMDTLNIPEEKKKAFFKKFEQLTPTQFLYAYDNNDIINRIYELYFKRDVNGEVILNTDIDSAIGLVDTLFEQVDLIIEEAKLNSV